MLRGRETQNDEEDVYWRFIDDRKRNQLLEILEGNLAEIDLTLHPEELLKVLTSSTKDAIQSCFPYNKMSNTARKDLLPLGLILKFLLKKKYKENFSSALGSPTLKRTI